ncbi:MAG: fibro-slime domain-containing protein [Polyangiaceae bacterium]
MREQNPPSNSSLPRPARVKICALRVSLMALPVLCGLVACGGSADSSQVQGGAGFNPGITAGGNGSIDPGPGANAGTANANGGAGSMSSGVYMLPEGFTPATLGGFKLGAPVDASMTGAAGASSAPPAGGCGTQILGVVRDFKGNNEPGGHPDFEHFSGSGPSPGIVTAALGSDQKPVYAATGAFMDPVNGQQTTSKMLFDEWYRATPNVNKPYIVYLYFQPNGNVLTFQSTAFFPLDGKGWGNTPGQNHNFGFTTEVHTKFTYKGNETFKFTGDDDLWVFINNKLAIDLGGLHSKATKTVDLTTLGLTVGETYNLDLFHAERHTSASNFSVDTNLEFTNCGTVIAEPQPK